MKNVDGDSALFIAASRCHHCIGSILLKYGANPLTLQEEEKLRQNLDRTLMGACEPGNESIDWALVSRIISAEARISKTNLAQLLRIAASQGKKRIVKILLRAGANPNIKTTPLFTWTRADEDSDCEHQHEHQHQVGDSPLFLASAGGHEDIAEILLQYGADPLSEEERGKLQTKLNKNLLAACSLATPHSLAGGLVLKLDPGLISKLLSAGADPGKTDIDLYDEADEDEENFYDMTSLMYVAQKGVYVTKLVIRYSSDVNYINCSNKTALTCAVDAGQSKAEWFTQGPLVGSFPEWSIRGKRFTLGHCDRWADTERIYSWWNCHIIMQ